MTRRKKIDRPKEVAIQVPESILTKVKAELYSEVEGKVPFGAFSGLVEELFTHWLRSRGVIV
jgi:hypothetical protein